jgi:hypothetical protein
MIDDYPVERLVRKYAKENQYTLVANTPGTLEYVKYVNKTITIMKWPKGSGSVTIHSGLVSEKLKLNTIIKEYTGIGKEKK